MINFSLMLIVVILAATLYVDFGISYFEKQDLSKSTFVITMIIITLLVIISVILFNLGQHELM